MKVTLLGVLAVLAGAALLVYVGYEWRRSVEAKIQPRVIPEPPVNP